MFASSLAALDTMVQTLCVVVDNLVCQRPIETLEDSKGETHVHWQKYVDEVHARIWGENAVTGAAPAKSEGLIEVVGAISPDDVKIFGGEQP